MSSPALALVGSPTLFLKCFFFNVYFLGQRESMNGGGAEREGDTESKAGSRLQAVSTESDAGLELTNQEIMTRAEVRRLNRLSHPSAPFSELF